jgi:hypothetical protein
MFEGDIFKPENKGEVKVVQVQNAHGFDIIMEGDLRDDVMMDKHTQSW